MCSSDLSDFRFRSETVKKLSQSDESWPLYQEWAGILQKVHSELSAFAKAFKLQKFEADLAEMEWLAAYTPEEIITKIFAYIEDTPVSENDKGLLKDVNAWLSINPSQTNPNQYVDRLVFSPNSLNIFLAGADILLLQQYDEQYQAVLEHREQMNREGKMPSLAGLYAFERVSQDS